MNTFDVYSIYDDIKYNIILSKQTFGKGNWPKIQPLNLQMEQVIQLTHLYVSQFSIH